MNAKRVLTINWGLWACFSLPPIIYFLFHREQDKAGDLYSGWAIFWLGHILAGPFWQSTQIAMIGFILGRYYFLELFSLS
jgi:hypothetical protein